MSYRLINANELNTVITSEDYDKVLNMPCIYADLPNGLDNNHYSLHKWIPVSEKLPKAEYGESDSVLVCFENEIQDVLYFDGGNWRYPTGEIYISVNHKNGWHNKVVAWMPLPEPYEPQESEK